MAPSDIPPGEVTLLTKLTRVLCMLLLAGSLPACATITSGTSQSLSVITEPAGATCTVTREGATVGVVNPTPGTLTVSKSARDMSVSCTREGHSPGVASVVPQFQAMTVGNILIGGFVGLAVDAASGAMSRYPDSVTIALPPQGFASAQSRDAFFEERAGAARRSFVERMAAIRNGCGPERRAECDASVQQLTREQEEELLRLERLRLGAATTG
jgi:hypothetical protein